MSNRPRKPTQPFGYIAFGKDGTVKKNMFWLSQDKEKQEAEAVNYFIDKINGNYIDIYNVEKLPEDDHDFKFNTSIGDITVELTELVDRDFVKRISKEEYNSGYYHEFIAKKSGELPWAIIPELRDSSIRRVIEKKINKKYTKSSTDILWLVVFSTSSPPDTVYYEGGQRKESKALIEAREYIKSLPICIFNEIWYTNLLTKPIQIWPEEEHTFD